MKKILAPTLICLVALAGINYSDILGTEQSNVDINSSGIDILKSYGINLKSDQLVKMKDEITGVVNNKKYSDDERKKNIKEILKRYTEKDWNIYSRNREIVWLSSHVSEKYGFETDNGFLYLVIDYDNGSIGLKSESCANKRNATKRWVLYSRYTKISPDKKWMVTTTGEISPESNIMSDILNLAENSNSTKDRQEKILKLLKQKFEGNWSCEKNFFGSLFGLSETYTGTLTNNKKMSFTVKLY